nr:hypothetical protein [Naviculales sp.]
MNQNKFTFRDKILSNYKRRKTIFGREETGYVTRINSRTSSNYYRIYQTKQGVKFELELKNPLVKSFQSFLFNDQKEIFEQKLALHFYKLSIYLFLKNFICTITEFYVFGCWINWIIFY